MSVGIVRKLRVSKGATTTHVLRTHPQRGAPAGQSLNASTERNEMNPRTTSGPDNVRGPADECKKPAARALPVLRDDHVRPDICAPCGGRCCKALPGAAMPEDFGADEAAIRAAMKERLVTGEWSIDWWEGDPRPDTYEADRGYFLRPATRAGRGDVFDPSNGGTCVFFEDGKGCRIFDARPTGCRGLEPLTGNGDCKIHYASKQDAAIAWLPYATTIVEVGEELGEDPPDDPPPFASWMGMFR